jgi:putative CocE/NonD family hydrolase
VRRIDTQWIPLADGTRLAATIWLPEDAGTDPVPAILEYIPYGRGTMTATRDALMHPYFAGHGYAAVRVDIRGGGDSDGLLLDEYLQQELDDAVEVIAWLAAQAWCTGSVGMMGKSWGGFNALQVAALRPPALDAIVTVCSTDDRYADDVHYMGGCVLAAEMLPWASTMLALNARPPDPAVVGDGWRDAWLERMERTPPFVEEWVAHQRRDGFWRHGSVCERYDAIRCPVFAVGGWADAYSNAVLRLLTGLDVPRRGLIGPWGHLYPHQGLPGPAVGFLQEAVRWWDQWLKGLDTGVMDEPMLRAWMQGWVPPRAGYANRPGRWLGEPTWPPADERAATLHLADGGLHDAARAGRPAALVGEQATGLDGGMWCSWGVDGDLPVDQRGDDGRSLAYTSEPLAEAVEILGFPVATLTLAADRPAALVAVRLCDVAPTGESLLVTRGLLNLTHRDGHEEPRPVVPGERVEVRVVLNGIAHRFAAGHRVRLAISPTYWPFAWPSPEAVALTVFGGSVELPVRAVDADDGGLCAPPPAESAPPLAADVRDPVGAGMAFHASPADGRHSRTWTEGTVQTSHDPSGTLEYATRGRTEHTIVEGCPLSAAVRCRWTVEMGRGPWRVRIETDSTMTADAGHFRLTNALTAYEGERRVFAKTWTREIARDHV